MKKNLNTPNTAAIILAAGAGTRAQQKNEKKQFCCIQGKTILEITLEIFISHPAIKHIALVIDPSDRNKCEKILQNNPRLSEKQLHIVNGGKTRQESAFLGLKALKEQNIDYVHIHDAARPFLQQEQITALQKAVQPQLGAILAIPISDTVKKADQQDFVIDTIERKNLYRAQTPQTFPYQKILAAHMKAAQDQIECTDDAMVAKYYGLQTKIIISTENNIKITWPEDLIKANQMKKHQIHSSQLIFPNVRVGHGYDVHSFVPGTHIFLCGIKIPFHKALNGHSDSDAPLHALTDALLSTIGYGDIGIHFPPSEEEWKNAPSKIFVEYALKKIVQKNGKIANIDITIIAEEPKIIPYREEMLKSLQEMLSLPKDRISLKATTHEKIGSIGRKEGIAAIATACVIFPGSL